MLADPKINHFYKNTDMSKLRCRQKQFITLVTGGPHNYEGTDMYTAHCKMDISRSDFDITWRHLEAALLHFNVDKILINELRTVFYSVEADVVKNCKVEAPKEVHLSKAPSESQNTNQAAVRSSGCPFKMKVSVGSSFEEEENKPSRLSKDIYMKLNY